MTKYTHQQALDIVSRVINLPHGPDTYDVVHMNGCVAVVHHHNNAEAQYSHLRGVVIDLDDEVMITKASIGTISPISIRDFKLTEGTLNKVYCGMEGTNMKVMKHKGVIYYVTNRRIYTDEDKDKVIYVKYISDILHRNPTKLFADTEDSAPYYHEFILVNKETSQLTSIRVPDAGFLVYVGTRITDEDEYKRQGCKPVVTATEFTVVYNIKVPITSRYICNNRSSYKPVSTIYPIETIPNTMEALCKYISYSKEFCIVTYTDDSGNVSTVRVCHEQYLHREGVLQFSDNLFKRYVALCRSCPMDKARNRNQAIHKYLSRHNIYVFDSPESVLEMMKKGKTIPRVYRDRFNYCKNKMDSEKFLINIWIDMYSCLTRRDRHQVYDIYSKYIKIVDTIEGLMTKMILGETPTCTKSTLKILNSKITDIKHFSPKESAFKSHKLYQDYLIKYCRRNIIQYSKVNEFHSMAVDLNLV